MKSTRGGVNNKTSLIDDLREVIMDFDDPSSDRCLSRVIEIMELEHLRRRSDRPAAPELSSSSQQD